jgi:hypothetical protein
MWSTYPPDKEPLTGDARGGLRLLLATLDPVLEPLGFASGSAPSDSISQVIYCRGDWKKTEADTADDGCVDLVFQLEANPDLHIVDVYYWGFPFEHFHLTFPIGRPLHDQLAELAHTLPEVLARDVS